MVSFCPCPSKTIGWRPVNGWRNPFKLNHFLRHEHERIRDDQGLRLIKGRIQRRRSFCICDGSLNWIWDSFPSAAKSSTTSSSWWSAKRRRTRRELRWTARCCLNARSQCWEDWQWSRWCRSVRFHWPSISGFREQTKWNEDRSLTGPLENQLPTNHLNNDLNLSVSFWDPCGIQRFSSRQSEAKDFSQLSTF